MKTFHFNDSNGDYGGAHIILSAKNYAEAEEYLTAMVQHVDGFECEDEEGEDDE